MLKRISLGWWVVLVVVGLTALPLGLASRIALLPEEAYYWTYAQHPAWGYFDHPPMVAWGIWLGTKFYGDTEFGVRFVNVLFWAGTCLALWTTARLWFDRRLAHMATLLFALLPISVGIGLVVLPDGALLFFWALTLLAVTAAVKTAHSFWWIVAGAAFGGALLSKYYALLLAPSLLMFLVLSPAHRFWLRRAEPWVALALALALFSPVIVWNAQHDWASFHFQSTRTAGPSAPAVRNVGIFWLMQLGAVMPLGLALFAATVVRGIKRGWMWGEDGWSFIVSFALPLWALFALASFRTQIHLNWTAPAFLALSMGGAVWLAEGWTDPHPAQLGRWRILTRVHVFLCVLVVVFLYTTFLFLRPWAPGSGRNPGWQQLGVAVESARQRLATETQQTPFILGVDKYNLAAVLGFYTGQPLACVNTFALGHPGLSYRYWTPLAEWEGRPAVAVLRSSSEGELAQLRPYFDELGAPRPVTFASSSRRQPVLWLVDCRGYHLAPQSRRAAGPAAAGTQ